MSNDITPCFWFDKNAEEAVDFYLSVFGDGKKLVVTHYGEGAPLPPGSPMTLLFEIQGKKYMAINGGPQFSFSPAISMVAHCEDQPELDRIWHKLSEGGTTQACGWLMDRYGVSWQIVPSCLHELMSLPADKSGQVMQALWSMEKLDIATLKAAAE